MRLRCDVWNKEEEKEEGRLSWKTRRKLKEEEEEGVSDRNGQDQK